MGDSSWDPRRKPRPGLCPGAFCFRWCPRGSHHAPGSSSSLEAALNRLQQVDASECTSSFGKCTRLDPFAGDADFYEPHEPNLARHGLPWFYFIRGPDGVLDDQKTEYIRESEALWGRLHWKA